MNAVRLYLVCGALGQGSLGGDVDLSWRLERLLALTQIVYHILMHLSIQCLHVDCYRV